MSAPATDRVDGVTAPPRAEGEGRPTSPGNGLDFLLADDHEIVRRGVRSLVEAEPGWRVCAEAVNGREAVEISRRMSPAVAILDVSMPELNGIDAAREIRKASPRTRVILFSVHDSEWLLQRVNDTGARALVRKADAATLLVATIKRVVATEPVEPPPENRRGASCAGLTQREYEIVRLLADGKSNWCIAQILDISTRTVETHRRNVMVKVGATSLVELVTWAVNSGIVDL
jgi:DNA-binding NarL/FixJ family response regulator